MALTVTFTVFLGVIPCSVVNRYQYESSASFLPQYSTLKMEAASLSEKLVLIYQTTRRHIKTTVIFLVLVSILISIKEILFLTIKQDFIEMSVDVLNYLLMSEVFISIWNSFNCSGLLVCLPGYIQPKNAMYCLYLHNEIVVHHAFGSV
jgi:hypothetical protein